MSTTRIMHGMNVQPHAIASVELFHLLFLEQLGRKLDKRHYTLKGGCNLRFFLRSIRYSEYMDLDVKQTSVNVLQDRVEQILESASFAGILMTRGMAIARWSAPKQTETTQRWKLSLEAEGVSLPIHTKIEFSRRGGDGTTVFDPIDPRLIQNYRLTPILASHYSAETAFAQKLQALIGRKHVQARDLFDLDHLLRMGVRPPAISPSQKEHAQQSALSISFDDFKSQVLSFLEPDTRAQFDDPVTWDSLVLRVIEAVGNGAS